MSILIIDSHSAEMTPETVNLHVRNSLCLSSELNADAVATEEHLRKLTGKKYDVVIFVHASPYVDTPVYVDWLRSTQGDGVKYIYITNEYNLGEPWPLWALCRDYGEKFHVIANHPSKASKVLVKNLNSWNIVNLNTLIYQPVSVDRSLMYDILPPSVIYYGAFRKDRVKYFERYFDERLIVSTSKKNRSAFHKFGINAQWAQKLMWHGPENRLYEHHASLYIEDEKTHKYYNFLANRFYEALSHDVTLFFDESCIGTLQKSGYPCEEWFIVKSADELHEKVNQNREDPTTELRQRLAEIERKHTLRTIRNIIDEVKSGSLDGKFVERDLSGDWNG